MNVDGQSDAGRQVGGDVDWSEQADEAGQQTEAQLWEKMASAGCDAAQEQSRPQETAGDDGTDWADRA